MLHYIRKALGIVPSPQIIGFRGYGSKESVIVLGRVIEQTTKPNPTLHRNRWHNMRLLLERFLARPYPECTVTITYRGEIHTVATNKNGFLKKRILLKDQQIQTDSEWEEVHLSITTEDGTKVDTTSEVLVEGRGNTFGIISDIDDTVLISNATRKIKLLYLLLTRDPSKRYPFAGVTELYKAFILGKDGTSTNPIFYVSSSQWNIYDYLLQFFELHNIPKGPLLLKEANGILGTIKSIGNYTHKKIAIEEILDTYPTLSFILIGDSGQKDARIYADIVQKYPQRILTIYIRDVTVREDRIVNTAIETLAGRVPLVLVQTSKGAADHARESGFITNPTENIIKEEVTKEQHEAII